MKTAAKKSFCFVLLLAMLLSMFSFSAYAEGYSVRASIPIQNTVVGGKNNDNANFKFKLVAQNDSSPMPADSVIEIRGNGSSAFDNLNFSAPGDYLYQISEINENRSGYTYDSSVYLITVRVTDLNGTLQCVLWINQKGRSEKQAAISFINSCSASATESPDSPQTGAASNVFLWLCLMLGSASVLVVCCVKRRMSISQQAFTRTSTHSAN